MKRAAVGALLVFLASTATAQLTPGVVVKSGEPFPLVADINGDGLDDLIGEHTVILSNGTSFDDPRDVGLPSGQRIWAVLDVNGDGIPDLLTFANDNPLAMAPPSYTLFIGNASRTYTKGIGIATGGAHAYVADVDGDGKDDLVLFTPVRASDGIAEIATDVTVMRSRGDGTFESLPAFRIPAGPQEFDVRIQTGDLDRDGLPDLVIRCPFDLVILHGRGGGRFDVETRYMPYNDSYGVRFTQLADVDGDGNLDIVMVGMRRIRVFFGDGHGKFPRMTTTTIAKTHSAQFPPNYAFLAGNVDWPEQPRDLAIGHFTRSDRLQIAGGMGEGDIVVFSYSNGKLTEDTRLPTEFWMTDIRSGKFRRNGGDSIYAMGTLIWGDEFPRPRVFNGPDALVAEAATSPAVRMRASRAESPRQSVFQIDSNGGDCMVASDRLVFQRDGNFGSARSGDAIVEALFDESFMYIRMKVPWSSNPLQGALVLGKDGYIGGANAYSPACGLQYVFITAKASAR